MPSLDEAVRVAIAVSNAQRPKQAETSKVFTAWWDEYAR